MNEELNIRPVARPHVDVDRKASREYLFGKKKESTKARCCECGVECDKSMMAWVGDGVYKCRLCLLMRRNDA
jgi:late competence protein required for DNA uptake (superfamily II DNA/RNA helicase)